MIGIISDKLSGYSILDKIHNSFPTVSIYLYSSSNIENGIELLKEKGCQIIVLKDSYNIDNFSKEYSEIQFLSMDGLVQKEGYDLDDKQLVQAVKEGNETHIKEILHQLVILEDKIILSNPILLYIRHLIEECWPDKEIVDNLDLLIEKIGEYHLIYDLSVEAQIKIIGDGK